MGRLTRDQVGALDAYAFLASRPAYVRKMAWLMPRMSRAVPYLDYIVVHASKPRITAEAPVEG